MNGKIYLHYDMDAFFASVEQRDNPKLREIPIAVGYGVVTTASYEARKYGVKSAMPAVEAKRLCPSLKFVEIRKGHYSAVGKQIQNAIQKVLPKCEFTSIDEGFIDITEFIRDDNIEKFIERFKRYIYKNVRLTCSVGIGFNKVSAKIASDINKPNGYFIFKNKEHFLDYIYDKELSIIPGIGKKTRELLAKYKVYKMKDLYKISKNELIKNFGNSRGEYLYNVVRGNHYSEIEKDKKTHSYGHEVTFSQAMNDEQVLLKSLEDHVIKLVKRLEEKKEYIKTVTLKIRYSNFMTYTRSKTMKNATRDKNVIYDIVKENFDYFEKRDDVRLIGVHLSSITKKNIVQLTFDDFFKSMEIKSEDK